MWPVMTKCLVLCLLLPTLAGASLGGAASRSPPISTNLIKIGLIVDEPNPGFVETGADQAKSCAGVSFTRNLKYGESDLNVLDVAVGDPEGTFPRPVLLFVTGDGFAGQGDMAGPLGNQAACFAAHNGMIGVKMAYRQAPANPWLPAAQDIAAALSWIHQNIDLFGGNREEIAADGYSTGAFHVASLLAHPEFGTQDSGFAGAVLVSGIYRSSIEAGATEKAYLDDDAS